MKRPEQSLLRPFLCPWNGRGRVHPFLFLGKAQIACNIRCAVAILGVVYAVKNDDFFKVERADALKTCDIDAIFIRVGAAFVMGVDAAFGAKIMLCGHRAELVFGQHILPLEKLYAIQWS